MLKKLVHLESRNAEEAANIYFSGRTFKRGFRVGTICKKKLFVYIFDRKSFRWEVGGRAKTIEEQIGTKTTVYFLKHFLYLEICSNSMPSTMPILKSMP